jgi:pyrroloquinoline-quinone synthase
VATKRSAVKKTTKKLPAIRKPRTFREQLQAAVLSRHCANHPLTEKWAAGEVSRNARMGWAVEHYHWVSKMGKAFFSICANAPNDVVAFTMENWSEENSEDRSHLDIVLRFAKANGASIPAIMKGRGLPTTESWVRFLLDASKMEPWIIGVAALNIGTESQSPMLYGKMLPSLRKVYKYPEADIEHFWLHIDADEDHGGRAFAALERHCTTKELKELAVHWAYESARMRWFYFDGIYLHYEMGYNLADR